MALSPITYTTLKVMLSAGLIVAISEVAKRSSLAGALLASLPLTSILAFTWLYLETGSVEKVAALSNGILWLVLPSLILFILLPYLLRLGWGFGMSLSSAIVVTIAGYFLMLWVLNRMGVAL